ncbi:MAG: GWxTD domain-containing protein [Balneola sp.]
MRFFFFSFSLLLILGCNNSSYIDKIDRGSGYKYNPGFPELRVVASSFIDQNGSTFVNIATDIVYGSLIYKKDGDFFVANGTVYYEFINQQNSQTLIDSKQFPVNIQSETNKHSYNQSTYKISRDFELPPGNYEVIVSFTDENTGKQSFRSTDLFIPDPNNAVKNITNIRIFSKSVEEGATFTPSTTYDIQGNIDSLKFVFQVTNNNADAPLTLFTKLLRIKSDTAAARPMNHNNYSPSSIQYEGIDYSSTEELNSNRRVLNNPGNVLVEFTYPKLDRGNYRIEVYSNLGTDDELYKARDFSVKSVNYPTLKTAKELAQPLIYIMTKKEYRALMEIEDESELKKAIDRFWLSNIKNSQKAKSVVELYYERVEQANKQFSNYKEGWKTDRGMIYILFGPPWYIDGELKTKVWSYSYNSQEPEKNFFFITPKLKTKYFPFNNYLLQRSSSYYNVHYQQIDYWRSGLILAKDL